MIAVVSAPLLARSREPLDFANYMWMAWVAGKGTIAAGHPVLFTNTGPDGPFYPLFAFYGGTLLVATGLLGAVIGIFAAYVGVAILAIAAAYLGTLSVARQLGVRGLIAHAPAICVVTSAYYITTLYARGDWPEFVAVSSVPPLAASGLYLIRSERWRPFPVLVFAVSAVILTGSHNLTLIWTLTLAAVSFLVVWLALGRSSALPYRRLAMVSGLALASLCVNGWFLVSDLQHAHDVPLGAYTTSQSGANAIFDSLDVLLNPLGTAPASLTTVAKAPIYFLNFYVNAPVWFLAWGVLGGGAILFRRGSVGTRSFRVWLALLGLVALLVFVIADPWWSSVPFPWDETQFPFRVDTYLAFAIAAVVLAGALAFQRAYPSLSRPAASALESSLLIVTAISVGLCVAQQWAPPSHYWFYKDPGAELVSIHQLPRSWYAPADYADASARVVNVPPARRLRVPWSRVEGDYFSGVVDAPPGPAPIETNVLGGAYVVQISGVRYIGRTATGHEVVRRIDGHSSGPVHLVIQTADTSSIVLGRILSILGLVALVAILALTCTRAPGAGRLLRRLSRRE